MLNSIFSKDLDPLTKVRNLIDLIRMHIISLEFLPLKQIETLTDDLEKLKKTKNKSINKEIEEYLGHITSIRNLLRINKKFSNYSYSRLYQYIDPISN